MSIFRCNKCGYMNEHYYESGMSEVACPKYTALVKVYDILFFVGKLLGRYFSVDWELQALKQQEDGGEENARQGTDSVNQNYNPLADVNLSETDILTTERQHEPLRRWFARANIAPIFNLQTVNMSGFFDKAAAKLGNNYQITKNMLGQISWTCSHNYASISLDAGGISQKDGQTVNNLCQQFYSHTLFSKYLYQKQEKIVRLNLQHATAIEHFFCGGWLEWFALGRMLEEAKQKGKDYALSCARNIKIEFDNEDRHELDVVFLSMGEKPVVVECKPEGFRRDTEKYVRLKKRSSLSDNRFVILAVSLEGSQAVALGSMYGLTFVTPKSIMKYLRMIM